MIAGAGLDPKDEALTMARFASIAGAGLEPATPAL